MIGAFQIFMCGINGFITSKKQTDIKQKIQKMNDSIIHRGPDSDGIFYNDYAGIGMRRLSIIDLESGDQPIYNEDKSLLIILNGEIYNYQELKTDLSGKGHIFSTKSDTEVVLHAYEEYGNDFLHKMNGMFGLAILNLNNNDLLIARDRAGEKPLHYYHDENTFIFASELKSILNTFNIKKEININALNQYLALTYIPAPLTIYNSIFKLKAGHYLEYKKETISITKYWDVDDFSSNSTYEDTKKELRQKVYTAVKRQMISDVPIGAFLSGGIDSSIIVSIMSELSDKPVNTFSIGFSEKAYDESKKAKVVADRYNTNHHLLKINADEIKSCISDITINMDEPFGDSSALPSFYISRFAGKNVKVVLTGDAGDELFGGYNKYLINYYAQKYLKIPKFIRNNIITKLMRLIPKQNIFYRKLNKVISNAAVSIEEKRFNMMKLGFKDDERKKLLKINYYNENVFENIYAKYKNTEIKDEVTRALYSDFKTVLEGDMLAKMDRMSMLNSIETRIPLLDKDVIRLAFKIKAQYKIKKNKLKYIFKDAFKDLLPKKIFNKTKMGFSVPTGSWFRKELKNELEELTNFDFIQSQNIFNYAYINKIYNDHQSKKSDNSSALWTFFIFQKWYKNQFC